MKAWKSVLAMVLILCLTLTMFAACAKQQEPSSDKEPSNTPGTSEKTDNSSDEPSTPADSDYASDDFEEDPAEITFYPMFMGGNSDGYEDVEKALNEYLIDKINVKVDLVVLSSGDYTTKVPLALSSGEKVDVFTRGFGPMGLGALYANNQILDIAPYLDEYAPEMKELMGDLFEPFRINGGIYGIPTYRILNGTALIGFRKDIVDDLGAGEFIEKMTTWAEYEQLLAQVKEKYTGEGMYGLGLASMIEGIALGGDALEDATTFDYCGDTIRIVGGLPDGKVECLYWNDALVQHYARFADWMQKGYCWPDSVYSSPEGGGAGLMKQNMAFSEIITSEVGVEATKKASIGYDYLVKPIKNIPIGSDQVAKFGLSVNINCEEPAAAMKFINLMYTDPYVMQLLVQGIEGEHYVLDSDGIADFPVPGETNSSSYHCAEFLFGNQFLLHPWSGNTADFRETSYESFKSAPNSMYLGFALDTSEIQNDVAAISAVNERYLQSLTGGGYTPEIMDELRADLKAAGIDNYVAEMQKQIDAWMANK